MNKKLHTAAPSFLTYENFNKIDIKFAVVNKPCFPKELIFDIP